MRNLALFAGLFAIVACTAGCTNKGQEMADDVKKRVSAKIEKGEVKTEIGVDLAMATALMEIAKEKGADYKITESEKETFDKKLEEYKKELHEAVKAKWGKEEKKD